MRMKTASWFETKIKYQKMQEDGTGALICFMLLSYFAILVVWWFGGLVV